MDTSRHPCRPQLDRITRLVPAVLAELAADSQVDGHGMVRRLITEWTDGRNQFAGPAEALFTAACRNRVIGICGLNRDPFRSNTGTGRLRRLYVHSACRRMGIGSALVRRVIVEALPAFRVLRLRTHSAQADGFYLAMRFVRVPGDPWCTHQMELGDRSFADR
jgi:GNAT superfamily N-acetyltransferase